MNTEEKVPSEDGEKKATLNGEQIPGEADTPVTKKKKHRVLIAVLSIFAGIILLVGVGGYVIFKHYYDKMTYESSEEVMTIRPDYTESEEESSETDSSDESESSSINPEPWIPGSSSGGTWVPRDLHIHWDPIPHPVVNGDEVYNLLLIGIDVSGGNSDCMILASINYTDKKVTLTSFMRDTVANIPSLGWRRLNSAFAMSGAQLLVATLENTYGVHIDNYVYITFDGLESAINAVGGIDLPLTVKEAAYCGITIDHDQVLHLDGHQALRHARDRSSFGSDYGRTQRQRDTIMAVVAKVRTGSLGEAADVATSLLPFVTHNIDEGKMLSLLLQAPEIINYNFLQQRIPYDGLYTNGEQYFLIPDFDQTIPRLINSVYD